MVLRRPGVLAAGLVVAALAASAMTSMTSKAATAAGDAPSAGVVRVVAADETSTDAAAAELVAALSLREKAAAVVMGHIPTTDPAALEDYMAGTGIGGFILMGANIPASEAQLRTVTAALTVDPKLPPLIAIDQEGGDVSRLPWDTFPSALTLKNLPADASRDAFAGRGALVERAGIGVNFGIVADVTDDASSFIYRRALGTTPASGSANVSAAVEGEAAGALSTLKHFPGHGGAAGDSHHAIPSTTMTKEQWGASEALPFQAGIEAGAPLLMFGHLAYTAVDDAPASLSPEWHRIAREELGFDGVSITDDLGMLSSSGVAAYADPVGNAVAAITAGNDMVLMVAGSTPETSARMVDGIVAAVESGELPAERLDDAAAHVMRLRLTLAAEGRALIPCADCEAVG